MTTTATKYTTDITQGTGLINETIVLSAVYVPGLKERDLLHRVLAENLLSTATEARARHVVYLFYKRFVRADPNVPAYLTLLRQRHVSVEDMSQIILLYTTRVNALLTDFITQIYQERIRKGNPFLDSQETRQFVDQLFADEKIDRPWSPPTRRSVSEHLTAALIDFRLIDRSKRILPFLIRDLTANYLLHELHFKGVADNDLPEAAEWALFGMRRYDVLRQMEKLAQQGHFLYQSSGELVRIAWQYPTMTDCLVGITR